MAYQFPVTYQPYYPTYTQPNTYQQQGSQQNASSLIWVQGEAGAKSYMVAPNNTIALWDSESQTVYLKSADASGMPSMRTLDYTIREDAHKTAINAPVSDYATKGDITTIQRQIDEIKANMSVGKEDEDESAIRTVKRKQNAG